MRPAANLCLERSHCETSLGIWAAVVEEVEGREEATVAVEVEAWVVRGDAEDEAGVFIFGDHRAGSGFADEDGIEQYGCQRALVRVAGSALCAIIWVEGCI